MALTALPRNDQAGAAFDGLPREADMLAGIGKALMSGGAFELAGEAYERALAVDPAQYDALLGRSALCWRWKDEAGARDAIAQAARARPIVAPDRRKPGKPNVLRLRSIDGARYRATFSRKRGEYKLLFKGGHFSIQNLVEKDRFNLYIANVLGDNLDAADLPKLHLFLNTISCADRGRADLPTLSRFLSRHPSTPVINHPDRVMETARETNSDRFTGAIEGLTFPLTRRITIDGKPRLQARALEETGFSYPLILRRAGTQTGKSVELVANRGQARGVLRRAGAGEEWYVIANASARDAAGRHRKMRCFFIDGNFYPVACLGSDEWQIHSGDRYRIMAESPGLQAEEQAYLKDPEAFLGAANFKALHQMKDAMGLDFFGIDYAIGADGGLVVFEANPAMRHNFDHAGNFPYTRAPLERVSRAFNAMVLRRCRAAKR